MVKDKDMQFFMINMKMKRKRNKKNWPSPTGIWTPDFWTNFRPKFEFLWRVDPSSSGFLELLDFTSWCPSFRIQFSVGPNVFSYFLSLFSSSRSCRCLLSSQWLINVSPLLFYLLDEQNIFLITFTCHISKAKTQTDRLFVFIIYQIWMHFSKTHTNTQEIRN